MTQNGPDEAEINFCKWPRKLFTGLPEACLHGFPIEGIWLIAATLIAAGIIWFLWPRLKRDNIPRMTLIGLGVAWVVMTVVFVTALLQHYTAPPPPPIEQAQQPVAAPPTPAPKPKAKPNYSRDERDELSLVLRKANDIFSKQILPESDFALNIISQSWERKARGGDLLGLVQDLTQVRTKALAAWTDLVKNVMNAYPNYREEIQLLMADNKGTVGMITGGASKFIEDAQELSKAPNVDAIRFLRDDFQQYYNGAIKFYDWAGISKNKIEARLAELREQ